LIAALSGVFVLVGLHRQVRPLGAMDFVHLLFSSRMSQADASGPTATEHDLLDDGDDDDDDEDYYYY
jgi:hypothetical protein